MNDTYKLTTTELCRLLRLYAQHKRITRSSNTGNDEHFLDLIEEAVNRLEQNWKRDMSV